MDIRLPATILALALALLATWLWTQQTNDHRTAVVSNTAAPTTHYTSLPTQPPAPTVDPRYRLAGTVVGDVRYAVIETPDGRNDLYRLNATVPGLGKLEEIHGNHAVFVSPRGRIELPVSAAPTATPDESATSTGHLSNAGDITDKEISDEGLGDEGLGIDTDDPQEGDGDDTDIAIIPMDEVLNE